MAFDIFDNFATDESKENEGVWVPCGTGRVKLARLGNDAYVDYRDSLLRQHELALEPASRKDATPEQKKAATALMNDIVSKALARHIVLGFEGLAYKGEPAKYSEALAYTMLGHKDFVDFVLRESGKVEHYRAEREKAQEKNS